MSGPSCCGSHEGETLRVVRVDGVACFYASSHGAGRSIPPHYHDRLQVCLLVDGAYQERYATDRVECRPGTVVTHAPGVVHEDRISDAGALCFQIAFDPARTASGPTSPADAVPVATAGPPPAILLDLWEALRHSDPPDPEDELTLEEGAEVLISALASAPTVRLGRGSHPWLGRVLERLRDDPLEIPTLQELSGLAGVSRSHLAGAFKSRFGCTVGEYVRQVRTRRAAALLCREGTSLSEVAHAAGFADQPHMNRTFKRQVGITPGTFRERFGGAWTPRAGGL